MAKVQDTQPDLEKLSQISFLYPDRNLMLVPGDPVPAFGLPCGKDERDGPKPHAGNPVLLTFLPRDDYEKAVSFIHALRLQENRFEEFKTKLLLVYSGDKYQALYDLAKESGLRVLYDQKQKVERSFFKPDNQYTSKTVVSFVLDVNTRIVSYHTDSIVEDQIWKCLCDVIRYCPQTQPAQIHSQAPVLLIPRVLDRDLCQQVIDLWKYGGHGASGSMRSDENGKLVGYIDYGRKRRQDHFMKAGPLKAQLTSIIKKRVIPEVKKAFCFDITRVEDYKIACYPGEEQGFFRAHRDNQNPGTAHRRFAMTINLNAEEYDGGHLRFAEHGAHHLYKPATGDAVIFGCSLLHEAMPVSNGDRFCLLSFFYDEAAKEMRNAYVQRMGSGHETKIIGREGEDKDTI